LKLNDQRHKGAQEEKLVKSNKRGKKVGRKGKAHVTAREKWELPILFDRRAAVAKVLAEDVPGGTIWENDHEAGSPFIWKERVTLSVYGGLKWPHLER
jgi:hypothetical protein